jgi:hypothetical protein
VINEHLTVEALRMIIANQVTGEPSTADREERRNRRAGATSVQNITNDELLSTIGRTDQQQISFAPSESVILVDDTTVAASTLQKKRPATDFSHSASLNAVAGALAALATQADELSGDPTALHYVTLAEQALLLIRRAIVRRTLPSSVLSRGHAYHLLNAELSDLVLLLRQHHTALAVLRPAVGKGQTLNLVLCRVPLDTSVAGGPPRKNTFFVSAPGRGCAVLPPITSDLRDWARRHLKLSQHEAGMGTALLRDLQEIFRED